MNEHDDFELKRALDALPRTIEPPDDLWPGIRAGLKAGDRRPGHRGTGASRFRIAALLALLGVSAGTLAVMRHNAGRWQLSSAALGARPFPVGGRFASGSDPAHLTVGTIGEVDVSAGTDVRLLAATWSGHRLALDRGTIHARISAPPRLFVVETPSGTAVDMGCAYTLSVDSLHGSAIEVTAGWVEFTGNGTTSLIPAGFRARTQDGSGIGLPVAHDAPPRLAEAVAAFETSGMRDDTAFAIILQSARPRDAVTLWHLVQRTGGSARGQAFQRLAALVPVPSGIPAASVPGDAHLMRLYWTRLPGTLPIVPEWQEKLWRLWLRVAG